MPSATELGQIGQAIARRVGVAKRGNSLRVMAKAVRWGSAGARVNTISPGIFITPLANDEWKSMHHQQAGDPAKLAQALLTIAARQPPPRRFLAGADAIATRVRLLGSATAAVVGDS